MKKKIIIIILILAGLAASYFYGVIKNSDQVMVLRIENFILESELRDANARIDSLRSVYEK